MRTIERLYWLMVNHELLMLACQKRGKRKGDRKQENVNRKLKIRKVLIQRNEI